jgi:ferredoxin-thioredoxin reductase catalytic subunit/rubredoxin
MTKPASGAVDALTRKLKEEAEAAGYHLNPDEKFARELVESLLVNEERYGYAACPCRLASGVKEEDLDIACYCALYVSEEVAAGKKRAASIPERRPPAGKRTKPAPAGGAPVRGSLSLPVWRCKVCGYLCAREGPPGVCPICKAKKDRFERFL